MSLDLNNEAETKQINAPVNPVIQTNLLNTEIIKAIRLVSLAPLASAILRTALVPKPQFVKDEIIVMVELSNPITPIPSGLIILQQI